MNKFTHFLTVLAIISGTVSSAMGPQEPADYHFVPQFSAQHVVLNEPDDNLPALFPEVNITPEGSNSVLSDDGYDKEIRPINHELRKLLIAKLAEQEKNTIELPSENNSLAISLSNPILDSSVKNNELPRRTKRKVNADYEDDSEIKKVKGFFRKKEAWSGNMEVFVNKVQKLKYQETVPAQPRFYWHEKARRKRN
jgi:hypothetical protein